MWYLGLSDMEISILGSKNTLDIVDFLLYSQPPCGIIITTADYFLLPYWQLLHLCLIKSESKWTLPQQKPGQPLDKSPYLDRWLEQCPRGLVKDHFSVVSLAELVWRPRLWLWCRARAHLSPVNPLLVEDQAADKEGGGKDVEHEDAHRGKEAKVAENGNVLKDDAKCSIRGRLHLRFGCAVWMCLSPSHAFSM
jgi:hypothetical protein